jgi:hypothetical protein
MMPRYFFETRDGEAVTEDIEGLELPNLHAAREEALKYLGETANEAMPDGDRRDFEVTIKDQGGRTLLSASVKIRVRQHH